MCTDRPEIIAVGQDCNWIISRTVDQNPELTQFINDPIKSFSWNCSSQLAFLQEIFLFARCFLQWKRTVFNWGIEVIQLTSLSSRVCPGTSHVSRMILRCWGLENVGFVRGWTHLSYSSCRDRIPFSLFSSPLCENLLIYLAVLCRRIWIEKSSFEVCRPVPLPLTSFILIEFEL